MRGININKPIIYDPEDEDYVEDQVDINYLDIDGYVETQKEKEYRDEQAYIHHLEALGLL